MNSSDDPVEALFCDGDESRSSFSISGELDNAHLLLGMATGFHLGRLLDRAPQGWMFEYHLSRASGVSILRIYHKEKKRWILGSWPYWMTVNGTWPAQPRDYPNSAVPDEFVFDTPWDAFAVLEAWRTRQLEEIAGRGETESGG